MALYFNLAAALLNLGLWTITGAWVCALFVPINLASAAFCWVVEGREDRHGR